MFKPWMIFACLLASIPVLAGDPPAQTQTDTEAWLRLQSSNEAASRVPQVQTDKERDQAMQRWLDSYKYAIPEFYRWTKVDSSGN